MMASRHGHRRRHTPPGGHYSIYYTTPSGADFPAARPPTDPRKSARNRISRENREEGEGR